MDYYLQSPKTLENSLLEQIADELDPNAGRTSAYDDFKEKYFHDLEGFAKDCIRWDDGKSLTEYQSKGMRLLSKDRRFSMRGPHGLGKTAFGAIVILWFALTRDGLDWKIPTLASAWRQLQKFLWPEVHKWARQIRWEKVGRDPFKRLELLTLSIKLDTGAAFAISSENAAQIEGAHADHLLYLFDESKTIPDEIWDAAEGAMSSGETYFLAISTPGEPKGRFYDIHARKKGYLDWTVLHVTLEDAIKAGRINPIWAKQRLDQWGEKSAAYMTRVLGEFASSGEDSVISLAAVDRAIQRWHDLNESGEYQSLDWIGLDYGGGSNLSSFAFRHGMAIKDLVRMSTSDTMAVTGRLVAHLKKRENRDVQAHADAIGIGSGGVSRAKEQSVGKRVHAFIANASTAFKDDADLYGFADLRSYAWWHLRELLEDESSTVALPDDDLLIGDLTAPRYVERSNGKIKVESKKDIKKRIKRSTDDGDAVIMAFCPPNKKPRRKVR